MTTVPRGLLDILKIVKSVDHKFNTGSFVPWNTPVAVIVASLIPCPVLDTFTNQYLGQF